LSALSKLWIKICGITQNSDAISAAELGADAIGLVFYADSPRAVQANEVNNLLINVLGKIKTVALFVDPSREEVERVLETGVIDFLQFHGAESEKFCHSFGKPYLKALHVKNNQSISEDSDKYKSAEYLLLDSYSIEQPGGTGRSFDWSIGKKVVQNSNQKVIIAGGLKPENIKEVVNEINPFGVDVSSGVELSPGLKDTGKLKKFIEGARSV
jgi:phosphoribosylanthranilate isomerase